MSSRRSAAQKAHAKNLLSLRKAHRAENISDGLSAVSPKPKKCRRTQNQDLTDEICRLKAVIDGLNSVLKDSETNIAALEFRICLKVSAVLAAITRSEEYILFVFMILYLLKLRRKIAALCTILRKAQDEASNTDISQDVTGASPLDNEEDEDNEDEEGEEYDE